MITIRDAVETDFDAVLRLNLESEHFLSPLDETRLKHIHKFASYHRVAESDGAVQGFLLVVGPGVDYDSTNYQWFDTRYSDFWYVDRVVIDARRQGQQIGRLLYEDLFGVARRAGIATVTCEYDVEPPNEPTRKFHARMGFKEVGSQRVQNGKKIVSLQMVTLEA